MGPKIFTGAQHALLAIALQMALAFLLAFLPAGTRAQVTGVAVGALALAFSGYLLGLRARAGGERAALDGAGAAASGGERAASLRVLREAMAPFAAAPWVKVLSGAAFVGLFGTVAYYAGLSLPGFPPGVFGEGGVARAMLAADANVLVPAVFLGLGAMLGVNARRATAFSALLGAAFLLAAIFGVKHGARYTSYELNVILAVGAAGALAAAFVTGFGVSVVLRRLAFVELDLVALIAGAGVFLYVAFDVSAFASLLNLPEEQLLLAAALFPPIVFVSFLTVGGSLGFLLFGGGRFDPGFRFELGVALRYLKAHRRDGFVGIVTVIAVVGVCLGVMALIVVLSIMSGFENDLKMKILGAHAHVVVNKTGDDFVEYVPVEEQIRSVRGVQSATAFVMGDAMISTDVGLSGTLVKGVDVASAKSSAELRRIVDKGDLEHLLQPEKIPGARPRLSFPPPPPSTTSTRAGIAPPLEWTEPAIREAPGTTRVLPGIIIGRELSKTLRAYVGDVVKLVSPMSEEIGPLGPTPKLRRFRVAGIFYSGMYEYDAKFTYLDMGQAQRFFGMPKRATGVEIKVSDIDDTARISEEIKRRVGGFPYAVKDWREMNKELFSALLLEKIAMFVALGMIVMVASFLIVAVLVMIVLQRKREIAILKSIGASDASIMKIFVIVGVILGVGGAVLGGLVGVGICAVIQRYGVDLDPKVFYIERLPVVMDWTEISAIAVAAIVISYLATIYPAMTAAQHRPVEGLRDD